jgi:hypothetical protein
MAVNPYTYFGWHKGKGDDSRVDASDIQGVPELLLPATDHDLHLASASNADTDWNVSSPTHPTLYIHSATTPTTDYGTLHHDGGSFVIGSTGGGITLSPASDLILSNNTGLLVGSTLQQTISNGDGDTALVPEVQILGTSKTDSTLLLASFNTTNDSTVSPMLAFLKSGDGTIGGNTVVATSEVLGSIVAFADDGTDHKSPAAAIRFEVDSSPGAGDMPGRVLFLTTADAGETLTEVFRITSAQNLSVALGNGLFIGNTAGIAVGGITPNAQVTGTTATTGSLVLGTWSTTDATMSELMFVKSGNGTIGSFTIVAADELLGAVSWYVDDGTDYVTPGARIHAAVDGTPGANDAPTRLVFSVTADAGSSVTEALRINNTRSITTLGGLPANVTAAGAILAGGGIAMTDVANAWIDDATHGDGTTTHYIGNQTITTSSDMRLKTDIENSKLDAMGIFRQMRVVDFFWTDPDHNGLDQQNKRGKFTGMLAQEMVDLAPWIINAQDPKCTVCRAGQECDTHKSRWFVDYVHLVPALVKGLQELDDRIAKLEAAAGKAKKAA